MLDFVAYLLYAFQRFDSGILTTPLYAALALGLMYTLAMSYRYLTEERGRAVGGAYFCRHGFAWNGEPRCCAARTLARCR